LVTLISKWFHEVKAPTIQNRAWKFNSALIFIWKEMWSFAIVKVLNVFVIWRNIQNTPYLHVIFAYKKKYKIKFDKSFCCVHQKYNYVVSFSIPLQKSSHQTKTWNSHNVVFAYKNQSEILFNLFFIRDLHVVSCFMLFLIHDHFINPKIELIIAKHLFWLQKEVRNHIRTSYMFFDLWPSNCGWFHWYFWLMSILWSKKLKSAKSRFWLQKGVKNLIRYDFLICDAEIVGGFICYFRLIIILSSQKLKNVKYRFWLQKTIKNSILQIFLISDLQTLGWLILFWLKMISKI